MADVNDTAATEESSKPGDAGSDSDFEVESGSVATFTPDQGGEESASAPEASIVPGQEAGSTEDAGDEVAATARTSTTADTTARPPVVKAKSKGKGDLEGRVSKLRKEVDTETYRRARAREDAEREEQKLVALRREREQVEKDLAARRGTKPDADTQPETEPEAEPEYPDYRKFETDEEFEAAVKTYKTTHKAWDDRRLAAVSERIKKEITDGVEQRFSSRDSETRARQAEQTVVSTLASVAQENPEEWTAAAETLREIKSPWYDPEVHGKATTPFLSDVVQTLGSEGHREAGDLMKWLGADADRTQRLADLAPTRQLRDAIVFVPPSSVKPLLEHFATPQGAAEFEQLKRMHPIAMNHAIGALVSRLTDASRGSSAPVRQTTKAQPAARPPVGSPAARTTTTGADDFEAFMADEDAKELAERQRLLGLPVAAAR